MKIRDRLSLFLTLSAAGVLLVISLVVYYSSEFYRKQDFLQELKAGVDWRQQQLENADYNSRNFQDFFDESSGVGSTVVLPLENKSAVEDSLIVAFPANFVDELLTTGYAEFDENEKEGIGRLFQQESGDMLIIVSATDRHGKAVLDQLKNLLIGGFLISLPLLYIFGRLSSRHILKPIAAKIQKARRISASNLHLRLNVYNEKDEMGQLAIAFNEMLDRLEAGFEMQKNFISNASHEIRNPLTAILGETEICLAKKRKPEKYVESLKIISGEAERLNALVTSLLSLAKSDFNEAQQGQEEVRLDEILMDARDSSQKNFPANKITADFSGLPQNPDWTIINGNPNLLRVAFTNLIDNACKFSAGKEVRIDLAATQNDIQIKITDQGVGIPKKEIKNILQPFYRARNARSFKGFGIGLFLTNKIISLHHGQMTISSEEGKGTTIEVIFSKGSPSG